MLKEKLSKFKDKNKVFSPRKLRKPYPKEGFSLRRNLDWIQCMNHSSMLGYTTMNILGYKIIMIPKSVDIDLRAGHIMNRINAQQR
jgi:hypothetical protein